MNLFSPLTLPNGSIIPNRLAKAAMEENLADRDHAPSEAMIRIYQAWAKGGSGLILTGNVMIDRRAMTGPAGVVLEDERHLDLFRRWAQVGRSGGGQLWMQINHPGRQMRSALGQQAIAPSAVPLAMGSLSNNFAQPRAMTEVDINDVLNRFTRTAVLAEASGFTGVQVHAAHGYLLSQFLSPLVNQRQDHWGGSLENRARLLLDIVRAIRQLVSPNFSVSVKLNSADFQRGGFSQDDALQVVKLLNNEQVDLVELSGGSFEAPAMMGQARDEKTLAREAYFLEFAKHIQCVARMPLMVTGGIGRKPVAEHVINVGIAMVGMATALAINPALPAAWASGEAAAPALMPITWKNKVLASGAQMAVVKHQLLQLSRGLPTNPNVSPLWAFVVSQLRATLQASRYGRWMKHK